MLPRCLPLLIVLGLVWLGVACRSSTGVTSRELAVLDGPSAPVVRSNERAPATTGMPTATSTPTSFPTMTATPLPSGTPTATVTPSPTATVTPTATPIGACAERVPTDDLLTLVSVQYPISRAYEPSDLVPLADYFSVEVTKGYPNEVRAIIIEPLQALIAAMQAEGLRPEIISGYRSYAAQYIARSKWERLYPAWVDQISARPGTSEHQLGTTVDFGSPELPEVVGEEGIEFHTYFFKTREGAWLLEHAHEYGFTLSYPRDTLELTGFYYEPWHYRYVGVELATSLREQGITLTQYLLETQPLPCIPEE